jgi:serine/threonine protein kinase
MADDAFDIAVAQFAKKTGLATADQVVEAMQVQSQHLENGTPITLAEALVKVGVITAAQRENVEKNARAQKSGVQQLLHFRLLKKLGEGGMGAVYLAEDDRNNRKVAVKVLPRQLAANAEFLKRFRREADAAAKLKHPNIVGAYETGQDLGYHFYVMEFCEGEPLDRLLKREGALPYRRATEITLQAAQGLKYAHDQGFIHRDIKPANIFLTKEGASRLLDLGLTKRLEDKEGSFKTVSGAVLGTPHYISPEQAQGEKGVDGRSDIYSLGATYYHLLTGQTPFDGSTLYEILSKHVTALLPNPQDLKEDIPDGVVHVLRRMMAKDPADRYAACGDLLQDLQEVLTGQTPKTLILDPAKSSVAIPKKAAAPKRPPTVRRTAPPPQAPRSKKTLVAVAAGALVVIGAAILLMAGSDPKPRRTPTPAPPDSPAVAQKPPAPIAEAARPREMNLLPLIDLDRDVVKGRWTIREGSLYAEQDVFSRIMFPYEPPEEYDFSLEFVGRPGSDVTMVLSRPGKAFVWQMGVYNNEVCGFSLVKGSDARNNPTTVRAGLTSGQRYDVRVEVRRSGVTAFMNGRKVSGWQNYSDLDVNPYWRLPEPRLGLGVNGEGEIHKVQVVEISGPGQIRKERPAPTKLVKPFLVRRWAVIGPFPATGAKDLDVVHPPEQEVNFQKTYPGKGGTARWVEASVGSSVDLVGELFPNTHAVAYAVTYLDSPADQDATMSIAGDDCFRAWLNGALCHESRINRNLRMDHDLVPVRLRKGRNELRLKIAQETGEWAFAVAIQAAQPVSEFLPDGIARTDDVAPMPGPVTDEWVRQVSRIPPRKKLKHVQSKLSELNPGYNPEKQSSATFLGNLVQLTLTSAALRDISPLRALSGASYLAFRPASGSPGPVQDLSPLKDLQLTYLIVERQQISDLSPLRGMPLKELQVNYNPIEDLSPLQGMKLSVLNIGMTRVKSLAPLAGMPLWALTVKATPVVDLSPLKGMALNKLNMENTTVRDLSPLQGHPIREIELDPAKANEHRELLTSFKELAQINRKPAAEFWTQVPKTTGWVDLLNGRDLSGWHSDAAPKVVDGAVQLRSCGIDRPVATAEYEVEGALRILKPNSDSVGIGISLREPQGPPRIKLYFFADGDIHLVAGTSKVQAGAHHYRQGEWFRFAVRLKSSSLTLEIDGKEVLKSPVPVTDPGLLHFHAAGSEADVRELRMRVP